MTEGKRQVGRKKEKHREKFLSIDSVGTDTSVSGSLRATARIIYVGTI